MSLEEIVAARVQVIQAVFAMVHPLSASVLTEVANESTAVNGFVELELVLVAMESIVLRKPTGDRRRELAIIRGIVCRF